jgi:hypothetical protein
MSNVKLTVPLDKASLVTFGEHLRGEGRAPFALSATGRVYARLIDQALDALVQPAPVVEPAPADPLATAMQAHTEDGRALWFGLSSVALSGGVPVAAREAATRVLALFGGKAPGARMLPAERVVQATLLRAQLRDRAADLALLPLAPAGVSYATWLDRWCEAGIDLADRLVDAAVARGQEAPDAPGALPIASQVTRLNGLLRRARHALRDEIAIDPALPRTLEAEVFGLYDSLVEARRHRAEQAARRAEHDGGPAENDVAPTETPATDPPAVA